jgi:hypothetical protein
MEDPPPYHAGPTDNAKPPLATEDLIAQAHAHAHRQGIPYETGEQWLERLPERLRALVNLVPSGKARTGEGVQAVATRIDRIEQAPAARDRNRQGVPPHGPPETARPRIPGLAKPLRSEAT